jgi:hypothetical protein
MYKFKENAITVNNIISADQSMSELLNTVITFAQFRGWRAITFAQFRGWRAISGSYLVIPNEQTPAEYNCTISEASCTCEPQSHNFFQF